MDRVIAYDLLCEHTASPALRRHALAVEGVMRHYAAKLGEDAGYWGTVGLLHDVDYEKYPDEHCTACIDILKNAGFDDSFIYSVRAHGYGLCTDCEPKQAMEKVLYTIDELTGLINAAVLMRPTKSIMDLELASIVKKFKDKKFAAGCNRDIIQNGCTMMGAELGDVIQNTIDGMRSVADDIGLRGEL